MKNFIVLFAAGFFLVLSSAFAGQCRVMDPELANHYEGGCSDGWADGYGTAKGVSTYQGRFNKGKKHGHGIKVWANGDRYEGDFKHDMRDGAGSYLWGAKSEWPGDLYVGEYRNDKHHGQGVYEWASGDRFEGIWKENLRYGPSAMEIQKSRTQAALIYAVGKPGVIVCMALSTELDSKEPIRGKVEKVVGDKVEVRIISPVDSSRLAADPSLRSGLLITMAAVDCYPCN